MIRNKNFILIILLILFILSSLIFLPMIERYNCENFGGTFVYGSGNRHFCILNN